MSIVGLLAAEVEADVPLGVARPSGEAEVSTN